MDHIFDHEKLDVYGRAKRIATQDRVRSGKELLVRVVAMLTRLAERFDPDEFRILEDTDRENMDDL